MSDSNCLNWMEKFKQNAKKLTLQSQKLNVNGDQWTSAVLGPSPLRQRPKFWQGSKVPNSFELIAT